ncbi:Mannose-1-phosphate guanyltransferase alpha [Camellia lanceoleosa]|nr:Mannose-1-phosphate guanyltransferase alpha [Camellia lanceoleosa]
MPFPTPVAASGIVIQHKEWKDALLPPNSFSSARHAHRGYGGIGTLLVIKVSAESANKFGEFVADPITKELLHYTEKPETFVSDLINCGVYVFTPKIFSAIQEVSTHREDTANLRRVSSFEALQSATRSLPTDFVRLDQDILYKLRKSASFGYRSNSNKSLVNDAPMPNHINEKGKNIRVEVDDKDYILSDHHDTDDESFKSVEDEVQLFSFWKTWEDSSIYRDKLELLGCLLEVFALLQCSRTPVELLLFTICSFILANSFHMIWMLAISSSH